MSSMGRGRGRGGVGGGGGYSPASSSSSAVRGGPSSMGRGRGANVNLPAWMTAALEREGGVKPPPPPSSSSQNHSRSSNSTNRPPEPGSLSMGRGRDNRPAWMTQQQNRQNPSSQNPTPQRPPVDQRSTAAPESKQAPKLNAAQTHHGHHNHRDRASTNIQRLERQAQELVKKEKTEKERKRKDAEEEETRRIKNVEQAELRRQTEECDEKERQFLEAVADEGLDENGEFETEEEREERLARERRVKRRKLFNQTKTSDNNNTEPATFMATAPVETDEMNSSEIPRNAEGIIQSELEPQLHDQKIGTVVPLSTGGDGNRSTGGKDTTSGTESFDMFSSSVSPPTTNNKKLTSNTVGDGTGVSAKGQNGVVDDVGNYDDVDGYYNTTIGEIINFQSSNEHTTTLEKGISFRVLGIIGKGVFSTVLKCATSDKPIIRKSGNSTVATEDVISSSVVAMKMIRNNEIMSKAALKELRILRLLCAPPPPPKKNKKKDTKNTDDVPADAEVSAAHDASILANNHYIVTLFEYSLGGVDSHEHHGGGPRTLSQLPLLEYRNHTALVFEYHPFNLRETLSKFGKGVGINLSAVRSYARQLFIALEHLAKHRVVHADIKPDNILVSSNFASVKLCDFGSAFFETDPDNDPTPYLVSRFYRPPEVIMGMGYDRSVDLWSVSVTLLELFTGDVGFPGRTNNDMLRRFMETLGPFSNRMIRRHVASYTRLGLSPHFESVPGGSYNFLKQEVDRVTGRAVVRAMSRVTNEAKQLHPLLLRAKSKNDDRSDVMKFADLLQRCLALDPARRIPIEDALAHDFIHKRKKIPTTDSNGSTNNATLEQNTS